MAKEPTASKRTPEQIAAMEAEVAEYRRQEREAAVASARELAAPIISLVQSDGFKAVRDAIPNLYRLALEHPDTFVNLRVYAEAARQGLAGIEDIAAYVSPPAPAVAPVAP